MRYAVSFAALAAGYYLCGLSPGDFGSMLLCGIGLGMAFSPYCAVGIWLRDFWQAPKKVIAAGLLFTGLAARLIWLGPFGAAHELDVSALLTTTLGATLLAAMPLVALLRTDAESYLPSRRVRIALSVLVLFAGAGIALLFWHFGLAKVVKQNSPIDWQLTLWCAAPFAGLSVLCALLKHASRARTRISLALGLLAACLVAASLVYRPMGGEMQWFSVLYISFSLSLLLILALMQRAQFQFRINTMFVLVAIVAWGMSCWPFFLREPQLWPPGPIQHGEYVYASGGTNLRSQIMVHRFNPMALGPVAALVAFVAWKAAWKLIERRGIRSATTE
ncbi:MAG: hypothetical protein AB7O68_16595 [Pirellulales bacterium]